jgi:hypothetical protein
MLTTLGDMTEGRKVVPMGENGLADVSGLNTALCWNTRRYSPTHRISASNVSYL